MADKPSKTAASTEEPVERDEYTAKQIATRIGTDAKTLRKFFRSAASTVEPVGQGGRYVFDAADLPKIKAEFEKYNKEKPTRAPAGEKRSTTKSKGRAAPASAEVIEDDDELLELDDDEPTEDDLEELEDVDAEDIEEFDDDTEELDEEDDEEPLEELDDEELDEAADGTAEEFTRDERRTQLVKMGVKELRSLARSDYDLKITGLKKEGLIDAILNHEFNASLTEVDDDEELLEDDDEELLEEEDN